MRNRQKPFDMRPDSFDSVFYGKWKIPEISSHEDHGKGNQPIRRKLRKHSNELLKYIGLNPGHRPELIYDYEMPTV